MSHGPSTQSHKITKPWFPICLTCKSRSQASLCLYTRHAISIRVEETFGRLRYCLGGDRPSQTTRLTLFPELIQTPRLELLDRKGGISTLAPPTLACQLRSLPPILHIPPRNPISGYSKAPRGLSVLLRETCICTGDTVSLSPMLRQRPDRYSIRAGRNLPDKEFRYLRTVIVTAAVYWGFNS
jgi:hypothetical protein